MKNAGFCLSSAIYVAVISASLMIIDWPKPARAADLSTSATAGEVAAKQKMNQMFPSQGHSSQATPSVIQQLQVDPDETGSITTYQPNGATITKNNAFFQDLGTNGRTCFTCHQPQNGWGLSAEAAEERFADNPNDPLFRLVDGATCPSADVSSLDAMRKAYSLVISKGLIRIGLPMQAAMQFQILDVQDPYGCNTNPLTGMTGAKSGILSFYRRPLPTANLGFLSAIMWDGREPDLFHQSIDATLGHAEGKTPPTMTQQRQIVSFEGCTAALTPAQCSVIAKGAGVFASQTIDAVAGDLTAAGATGGPLTLADQFPKFFLGQNDTFDKLFNPVIFTPFEAWAKLTGTDAVTKARLSIARGEQIFNSTPIKIRGVAGLNDAGGTINGSCGTCHDTPNTGNRSVNQPLNIGVANAGDNAPPALDISELPVFTVLCTGGPLSGKTFKVTDLGRAMITGDCADIGKVKAPILRGLTARSPYFHNGAATSIEALVEFYDQRFGIGLTPQQKADLGVFLESL